jgi:predicted acylesterase/phospholipase RssA
LEFRKPGINAAQYQAIRDPIREHSSVPGIPSRRVRRRDPFVISLNVMLISDCVTRARAFLRGEQIEFEEANRIWKCLKKEDELSLARAVLERMRTKDAALSDGIPAKSRAELCRQHAELTSKDPESNSGVRHDRALKILMDWFDFDSAALDGDTETMGIAGGIYKRRWNDLGQLKDLLQSAKCYERGAKAPLGDDAYPHINCAFIEDLLAKAGDQPNERRARAEVLRKRIIAELAPSGSFWNATTLAQAYFGLGLYSDAIVALESTKEKPAPWQRYTTAQQFVTLAHLREEQPMGNPDIVRFFQTLLPEAQGDMRSVSLGKVGLALSGGGFRASFYHLGVLARLAELDVLRHVEVLSCVSGGSIVGTCYWLALRQRFLTQRPMHREDYTQIVKDLIDHFRNAVATDLRGQIQPAPAKLAWRVLWKKEKGALDPEIGAKALAEKFYRPLLPGVGPLYMHDLKFTPPDYKPEDGAEFNPTRHNWLRAHKVPALVINATTVNTGHAWQFTPTWMGESPWAVYPSADSVPRLEWSAYSPDDGWKMEVGRAVAASACVPFVFAPLRIDTAYDGIQVQLVDGGVHDNQGTVSLLALNCNVLLVSDASGQLLFESGPAAGLGGMKDYAQRAMDTLMERVRLANYADLSARVRSGLLRGMMFLHMKDGLDADVKRLRFSKESYDVERTLLSPCGVLKTFQKALAELRTDLDDFTEHESLSLMACGYQMAAKTYAGNKDKLVELSDVLVKSNWVFDQHLTWITSTTADPKDQGDLLAHLEQGHNVKLFD